ncbi:MAG: molybdopterin-dependent oxidoreductase [Actinobacteria bacterium]|nr:molybdopterin-dependent oxidoreductase [Actinomycetota bacterium]
MVWNWIFWLHRAGGLALVVLLVWKAGIAARSYRRRGVTVGSGFSAVVGVIFLGSLATGLLWATAALPWVPVPVLGSWTVLSLHVALSLLLVPLFVVQIQEVLSAPGAPSRTRRFTGSREEASFAGNLHPFTNWLSDPIPRIDPARWRLRIRGEVERETTLSYEEVLALGGAVRRATLDCTGGWYTVQRWSGVPVAALLERAGMKDDARSLLFRSATGYSRLFPLEEADDLLLATHVGHEALSAGHGFPLRLVAPGHRGYGWVKWVSEVEVSRDPAWLEPPLPLQ